MDLKSIKKTLLLIVLSLAITACGGSSTDNQEANSPSEKKVQKNSNWHNKKFSNQTGKTTATFTAKPSGNNIDGVIGFSNGEASKYADLGIIVRFATSGYIDARNGSKYKKSKNIKYSKNKTYSFKVEIDFSKHTYNVFVKIGNNAEVQLANNFKFRTEQSNLNSINNVAHYTQNNEMLYVNNISFKNNPTNNDIWHNISIPSQNKNTTVIFEVTPSKSNIDGVIGLSNTEAHKYSDLAMIVRFAESGYIDARDGSKYRKINNIVYSQDTNYKFILDINFENHTYDVYVSIDDGSKVIQIGDNFKFRLEQSNLNNINTIAHYTNKNSNQLTLHTNNEDMIIATNINKKISESNIDYMEFGSSKDGDEYTLLLRDISNSSNPKVIYILTLFNPLGSNIINSGISEDNKKLYFIKYSNEEEMKMYILDIQNKNNIITSTISIDDYPSIKGTPTFTIDSSKLITYIHHSFNDTNYTVSIYDLIDTNREPSKFYNTSKTNGILLSELKRDYRIDYFAYNNSHDKFFVKLTNKTSKEELYRIYNILDINTPTIIESAILKSGVN